MNTDNNITGQVAQALNGGGAARNMDKTGEELRNNFMTLLVTQLQNQDPTDPMKNNELTSQLAQINTVSGIDALNETLDGITGQIEAGQSLQAAGLIGKGVMVPGESVLVGAEGASTPYGIELSQPAQEVSFKVVNAQGEVVHRRTVEAVEPGVRTFSWDGKLASGETAPPGAYKVEVEAVGMDGDALKAAPLSFAMVNGVSSTDKGVRLDLGGVSEPVTLDDVRQIL